MALSSPLLRRLTPPDAAQLEDNFPMRRILAFLDAYSSTATRAPLHPRHLRDFIRAQNGHVLDDDGTGAWVVQLAGVINTQLVIYFNPRPRGAASLHIDRVEARTLVYGQQGPDSPRLP